MIKWIACFLIGHSLNLNIGRVLKIVYEDGFVAEKPQCFCTRCNKFRTI